MGRTHKRQTEPLSPKSLYRRIDEEDHKGRPSYTILYMFFWPWNAPYVPLAGHSFGAHVADLEHVRVIVDKRTMRIVEVRAPETQPDGLSDDFPVVPNIPVVGSHLQFYLRYVKFKCLPCRYIMGRTGTWTVCGLVQISCSTMTARSSGYSSIQVFANLASI